MAVISKLNLGDKDITLYDNEIISNINLNGVDFHFAKTKEVEYSLCKDAVAEPIIDMTINGNSVQDGIPSVETPIEIQSVGNKTRNLLPFPYQQDFAEAEGTIIQAQEDGGIKVSGTATGYNAITLYQGKILGSGKITLSAQGTFQHACLQILINEGNTILFNQDRMSTSVTIDLDEYPTADTMLITAKRDLNDVLSGVIYPQLELGETATEFQLYGYDIPIEQNTDNGKVLINIHLTEPLRKVGDVADYIDYKNKKVVRNIGELVCDEKTQINTTPYVYQNMNGVMFRYVLDNSYDRALGMSNYSNKVGKFFDSNSIWLGVQVSHVYWIGILDILGLTTVDEFKGWIKDNNLKIIYQLNTPTEETINLAEIKTVKGDNKFIINTDILPSGINFKYWKQIRPQEDTEEILQDGTNLFIVATGAEITQSGNNLMIGG